MKCDTAAPSGHLAREHVEQIEKYTGNILSPESYVTVKFLKINDCETCACMKKTVKLLHYANL